MNTQALGKIGIWSMELRFGDKAEARDAVAEIDELGFGAVWIPGGIDGAVLDDVSALLAATHRTTIATGILNIWMHKPQDVAAWYHALPAAQQQRVMLGLGVSHGPIIGDAWKKPVAVMSGFLDALEQSSATPAMPRDKLCIAALGPKMLELAKNRTAGAHPYLVMPEHTKQAREILGTGKLLAPEQGVIFERDADKARAIAREALAIYAQLPNYRNNWLRFGFTEDDANNMSDRLIDALFAWGGIEKIVDRVKAHQQAGADHVCLQVIRSSADKGIGGFRAACRELAAALL